MLGLVITVVVAVVLAFCGCVGLGALGGFVNGVTSSGEPYDEPYVYGPDEPTLTPAAPAPTTPAQAAPATTPSGGPGRFRVVYEVTGTGAANVDFYDANGDFVHVDRMKPPWRLTFTANDRKQVQIVAVADNQQRDGVTCRITIDGKVVSQESTATDWIATCFGW
ncbi:MmpS family transport accessory protein [Micromonospora robiginosa]|uniref:MmpS family transport accessory protein n=1 Tax=Micromonospora robiginosa TaxID=2749844 RepID=A0AAF0P2S7_9ACTN|nr:MmpS family transport accessory protein [Micromonospora ferruginea]WMF04634.1 MmpS family transport accessory protein [Micromonospora ferruginea]